MQARVSGRPGVAAYSLMSQDHVKLKYLFDLIKPAVVDGAGRPGLRERR